LLTPSRQNKQENTKAKIAVDVYPRIREKQRRSQMENVPNIDSNVVGPKITNFRGATRIIHSYYGF
jgi:hypothetical protein